MVSKIYDLIKDIIKIYAYNQYGKQHPNASNRAASFHQLEVILYKLYQHPNSK
jgi:hypothetical protein